MGLPEDIQSSFETVRAHDPDRYLTALMVPRSVRGSLMALYAFNVELARIPGLITEPALGDIRLQWWRDVIENIESGTSTGSPIADALGTAISTHKLPKPLLLGMIDARSADLDGGGFADLEALRAYLYKREGALFSLSARILDAAIDDTFQISNLSAVAFGLTNILRSLPLDASEGRVMLPLSILDKSGLEPEQILAGEGAEKLKPILLELSIEARSTCDDARQRVKKLERNTRPAFAPLALVEPYLRAMDKPGHRPLQDIADINPMARFWKLWRAS